MTDVFYKKLLQTSLKIEDKKIKLYSRNDSTCDPEHQKSEEIFTVRLY